MAARQLRPVLHRKPKPFQITSAFLFGIIIKMRPASLSHSYDRDGRLHRRPRPLSQAACTAARTPNINLQPVPTNRPDSQPHPSMGPLFRGPSTRHPHPPNRVEPPPAPCTGVLSDDVTSLMAAAARWVGRQSRLVLLHIFCQTSPMGKLTADLCLTLAVLLGSVGYCTENKYTGKYTCHDVNYPKALRILKENQTALG